MIDTIGLLAGSGWAAGLNLYLVTWGQNVCRPVYPLCGSCAIADLCPRIGVAKTGKPRPRTIGGEERIA